MSTPDAGLLPRNDTELVRYAVRIGLVAGDLAEQALARFTADGTAALTDLIARGALDRERVLALRDGQFDFMDRLGTYRLFEVLGHGGMGVVYRAHDERGGEAAVKVLSPHLALDRVYQQRFLREAQAAASVASPFVVRCHGGGSGDGRYWIAMELMRGGNAEDAAERECGRLPPERCLRLMRDAAEGLEAIDAAGLVHRDIKPANLFLTEDGRAKLGDFGIARLPEDDGATRLTAIGRTLGTPGFMAPEQASAVPDLDIRADVYGIGATLYCLLTGQAPFIGSSNWLVMSQALAKPLPDPRDLAPECPPAVAAIVRGCGALRRDDRYLTPALLRADIERVLAGVAPRHLPVAAMAAVASSPTPKRAAGAPELERRILIVDDDPLLTRIHESKFTSAGWEVSVAHDGATALERVATFRPTIMLLDLVLPGLDGPEVIRRLRRDAQTALLPIVVLSNAYFADELRAAREAGADLILSKVDHGPRSVLEAAERMLADDSGARRAPAVRVEPPSGRIDGGLARSGKPALAAALRALAAVGDGPDARGDLLEVANNLRPLTGLSAAARAPYAGTLASAGESLARLLHSWPRHVNPSSLRTLRQACDRLDAILAGDAAPDQTAARALVVDDDPVSRNTMVQAVRKVNVQVEACADAGSALAALASARFDIVLCDMMKPGLDAAQLVRRVRADPRNRDLPIIAVTGLGDVARVLQPAAGERPIADDVIAKPFLLMELATKTLVHLR